MSVHFRTLRVKIQSKKKWGTYYHYYVEIQKQVLGIQSGFGYQRVSVLGMNFNPNWSSGRVRVLHSGFGFGCPDPPPEPNPTRCHPYPQHLLKPSKSMLYSLTPPTMQLTAGITLNLYLKVRTIQKVVALCSQTSKDTEKLRASKKILKNHQP